MNKVYSISRNNGTSNDQNELRDELNTAFDDARDIEEIFKTFRKETDNAIASSNRRHLTDVESEDYYDGTQIYLREVASKELEREKRKGT